VLLTGLRLSTVTGSCLHVHTSVFVLWSDCEDKDFPHSASSFDFLFILVLREEKKILFYCSPALLPSAPRAFLIFPLLIRMRYRVKVEAYRVKRLLQQPGRQLQMPGRRGLLQCCSFAK
jgi:hypothetical protein